MGLNKQQWTDYKQGKKVVNLIALLLCGIGATLIAGQMINYIAYTSLADEVQVLTNQTQIGYKAWDWMTGISSISVFILPLIVILFDSFLVDSYEREARTKGNQYRAGKKQSQQITVLQMLESSCQKNIKSAQTGYITFIVIIGIGFIYAGTILIHCTVMLVAPPDDPPKDALVFFRIILSGLVIAAVGHIMMLILYAFNLANVKKVCNATDDDKDPSKLMKMWRGVTNPFDPTQGAAARYVKFA